MKKVRLLLVAVMVYVMAYIPISFTMGAYGEFGIEGLGVEQRWALYSNRDNVLTRQRQHALEVIFYPLFITDRTLVHRTKRVGIEID